jgi:hypothetical protein
VTLSPERVNQGLPAAAANAWPVSLPAPPTITEKQDQPASTTATWTSATALNTALTNTTVSGYGTATVSIQTPSTATAGVITLEVTDDGATWYPAGAVRVDNGQQENAVALAGPGVAQTRMYAVSVDAMTGIRARLSTVIVGTGNTIVRIGLVAGGIEPFVAVVPQRTPVTIFLAATAGITTEALATTLTIRRGDAAAVTAATTYAPTAGRTFRLMSAYFGGASTSALINASIRVRSVLAGTAVLASPERLLVRLGFPASTAAAGSTFIPVDLSAGMPGLLDVPPGGSLAVSHVGAGAATYTIDVTLAGYEF